MSRSRQPAASPSPILPYAWVILAVIYCASVVAPVVQFKVPPIMPVLMQAFAINLTQAGWLMSVIALIGCLLALPAGVILQRLGAKTVLLIALACMALGSILGVASLNFGILLAGRVLEGIGIGLMGVTAPATIARWFPPDRQGLPMGLWATWVPIGTVLTFNAAPVLAAAWGWQSIWWAGAGLAVLAMGLAAGLVRQPPATPASPEAGPQPDLDWRGVFANRNLWLLTLEFTCFNFALIGMGTFYPTFLHDNRTLTLGAAGFVASLPTLVSLVSSPSAGLLSDRLGSRRLVLAFPFLGLAVLFLFPFRVSGWQITALMLVEGLIVGAIPVATFAAAPEVMGGPERASLGLAVILLGQNIGQLLGPLFFGRLVETWGWAAAGYGLIPVLLIGFVCSWRLNIR